MRHRVLVLGGYGNFGQPICRALAQDADIELLVGGRNAGKAHAFAGTLGAQGLAIDAQAPDLATQLRALGVASLDLLVLTHADLDHVGAALALPAPAGTAITTNRNIAA